MEIIPINAAEVVRIYENAQSAHIEKILNELNKRAASGLAVGQKIGISVPKGMDNTSIQKIITAYERSGGWKVEVFTQNGGADSGDQTLNFTIV